MQLFRRWDPRLNPHLRPHEWEGAIRRTRLSLILAAAVVAGVLVGVAVYELYPFDQTRALTPEQIAQSAGMVLLQSDGYGFKVNLTGESTDNLFPQMDLSGQYQKSPQLLHLEGQVQTGDAKVALEYYLEGSDLYIKHPVNSTWVLMKETTQSELESFYPDNLAAPLVSGVRKAEVIGKEKMPGGWVVELKLDLDPNVMLPQAPALHSDKAEYLLWVYTRNLQPARFTMSVVPQQGSGDQPERQTAHFAYALDLDLSRQKPAEVPPAVKQGAEVMDQSAKDGGQFPPPPPEPPKTAPPESGGGN